MLGKVPHSFEVHSNESACRKSGRLGLEQVEYGYRDWNLLGGLGHYLFLKTGSAGGKLLCWSLVEGFHQIPWVTEPTLLF